MGPWDGSALSFGCAVLMIAATAYVRPGYRNSQPSIGRSPPAGADQDVLASLFDQEAFIIPISAISGMRPGSNVPGF